MARKKPVAKYCNVCQEKIDPKRVEALERFGEEVTLCLNCAKQRDMEKSQIYKGISVVPSVAAMEILYPKK